MKTKFSNVIKISSVYVATTIGAAFASGQEILKFFTRFEIKSFIGVLISGVLFLVVALAVLDIVYFHKIKNSRELLKLLGGSHVGKFFEYMTLLFSFCVYIIMIAGAAALWNRITGFSYTLGVILRSQAVFSLGTSITNNWLVFAFLYVCYNSILNVLVMSSMYPLLTTRKTSIYSGILGGTALFFAMWVLNQALFINLKTVRNTELPMVELSIISGKWDFIIYSFILAFALITTAISSGYCCVEHFEQITKKPRWVLNICMGILAVPLANQGFSNMIDVIYPMFGYLGSSLFVLLMIRWIQLLARKRRTI